MSKPREFWISTDSFMMKNQSGGDMLIAHTKINKPEPTDLKVVEHSAFARVVEALKFYANADNIQLDMPIERGEDGEQEYGTRARQALADVGEQETK